jgi:hypothetical protein
LWCGTQVLTVNAFAVASTNRQSEKAERNNSLHLCPDSVGWECRHSAFQSGPAVGCGGSSTQICANKQQHMVVVVKIAFLSLSVELQVNMKKQSVT